MQGGAVAKGGRRPGAWVAVVVVALMGSGQAEAGKAKGRGAKGGKDSGVRCQGTTCQVDECWLNELLQKPGAAAGLARVSQAQTEGQPSGLVLSSVRAGSPLYRMGVRDGDVIKTVQGQDVSTPAQALLVYATIYGAIDSAQRSGAPSIDVSVQLLRGGKALDYQLHLNRCQASEAKSSPPPSPASR